MLDNFDIPTDQADIMLRNIRSETVSPNITELVKGYPPNYKILSFLTLIPFDQDIAQPSREIWYRNQVCQDIIQFNKNLDVSTENTVKFISQHCLGHVRSMNCLRKSHRFDISTLRQLLFLTCKLHEIQVKSARNDLEYFQQLKKRLEELLTILKSLPSPSEFHLHFSFNLFLKHFVSSQPSLNSKDFQIAALVTKIKFLTRNTSVFNPPPDLEPFSYLFRSQSSFNFKAARQFCLTQKNPTECLNLIFDVAWTYQEFPFFNEDINLSPVEKLLNIPLTQFFPLELPEHLLLKDIQTIYDDFQFKDVYDIMLMVNFEVNPQKMLDLLWSAFELIGNHVSSGFDDVFAVFMGTFVGAVVNLQHVIPFILGYTDTKVNSSSADFVATYLRAMIEYSQSIDVGGSK